MIFDTPLIGILLILVAVLGLICPIRLYFKLQGRFKGPQIWLIFGVLFGTLTLVLMSLTDFNVISDTFAHQIAKILIVLAVIFIAISSRKMYHLMKNVPSSLIDKISK